MADEASTSEPPPPLPSSSSSTSSFSHKTLEEIYNELPKSTQTPLHELFRRQKDAENHITNPITRDLYRIHSSIGTSTATNSTVYHGILYPQDSSYLCNIQHHHDLYFSMISTKLIPEGTYQTLNNLALQSTQLANHPNLLEITDHFITEDDEKYWVAYPYTDEGSLRSLIATTPSFVHGLSEDLIAVALQETLKGLCFLHQQGIFHRDINPGHIYVRLHRPDIKIGAFASIYEHHYAHSGEPSNVLPVNSICEWAAAPEVYGGGEYTAEADVWLVGITAIELAYGSIRVEKREDLEKVIRKFLKKSGKKKNVVGKLLNLVKGKHFETKVRVKGKLMSQDFVDFVASCLVEEREKRADASSLLELEFFKNTKGIHYFEKVVRKARRA